MPAGALSRLREAFRRMRLLCVCFTLAWPALLSGADPESASIHGNVFAQDGSPISGARVLASVQLPPQRPGTRQVATGATLASSTTGSNGAFELDHLPAGSYTLCVQAPTAVHIDPCHWSQTPPSVTLSAGQSVTNFKVNLKQGALLSVRLNDQKQFLHGPPGNNGTPHVLMGVLGPEGQFYPVFVSGEDSTGRNHTLTIPVNTTLRFTIVSKSVTLTDSDNQPIDEYTFPFRANSLAANPPAFVFNVTGLK